MTRPAPLLLLPGLMCDATIWSAQQAAFEALGVFIEKVLMVARRSATAARGADRRHLRASSAVERSCCACCRNRRGETAHHLVKKRVK